MSAYLGDKRTIRPATFLGMADTQQLAAVIPGGSESNRCRRGLRSSSGLPGKVDVKRAVQAARDSGIEVNAIELRPDGSIRLSEEASSSMGGRDLFEAWDKAGRL